MAWLGHPAASRRGRTFVAAGLVGWVAVIVVGAGPRGSEATTWLGVLHLDSIVQLLLLAVALVGLVLVAIANPFLRTGTEPVPRRRRGAGALMALLVLAVLLWRPDVLDDLVETERGAAPVAPGERPNQVEDLPGEPVAQLVDLLVVFGAIGTLALVWLLVRRARSSHDSVHTVELLPDDLADVLTLAHRQLFEGTDPRSAVIAAYATLEHAFATKGFERRAGETIGEHLRRATSELGIDPTTVARLGASYERARFSHHVITPEEQADAARYLAASRRTLEVDVAQ